MGDDPNFKEKPYNQGLSEEKFLEIEDYFENHPFNIDPTKENIEDNDILRALKNLKFKNDRKTEAQNYLVINTAFSNL